MLNEHYIHNLFWINKHPKYAWIRKKNLVYILQLLE